MLPCLSSSIADLVTENCLSATVPVNLASTHTGVSFTAAGSFFHQVYAPSFLELICPEFYALQEVLQDVVVPHGQPLLSLEVRLVVADSYCCTILQLLCRY